MNDPTASLWEAVVDETKGVRVELWPRGLADPRFAYRVEQVPASSHPTLAAALARIAGVRADDVVWDPFVGSGTELVERARLGPFRLLFGTDLDERALERARANLAAAGVVAELAAGDARLFRPRQRPTLILTNPPMGRRVLNKRLTGALYDDFLAHAAALLPPGGRLVWISPRADDTAARARSLGFTVEARHKVDMAGFWAELQAFTRKRARVG
jgi:23S rRNA G2445 N2-methylase RlmL